MQEQGFYQWAQDLARDIENLSTQNWLHVLEPGDIRTAAKSLFPIKKTRYKN